MTGRTRSVDYGNWVSTRRISGPLILGVLLGLLGLVWRWSLLLAAPCLLVAAYFALARWRFSAAGGDVQRRIQALVVDGLDWDGEGQALDIGCGSGSLAVALAKRFGSARVVGIDTWGSTWEYSRDLCVANAQVEGVGDRTSFERASAESLPFPDDAFDAVVSNLTFHEVPLRDKVALLREALRVLRPGGVFALQDLFFWRAAYGDADELVAAVRGLGASDVELVRTCDATWIPRSLRLPFMVGTLGLLKGHKLAAGSSA